MMCSESHLILLDCKSRNRMVLLQFIEEFLQQITSQSKPMDLQEICVNYCEDINLKLVYVK